MRLLESLLFSCMIGRVSFGVEVIWDLSSNLTPYCFSYRFFELSIRSNSFSVWLSSFFEAVEIIYSSLFFWAASSSLFNCFVVNSIYFPDNSWMSCFSNLPLRFVAPKLLFNFASCCDIWYAIEFKD